eukprot:TRINITY_DN14652_c0_g1_i1.p1 TRINITY_DN14652_c0_g1~~TRINITY_DN14652_c0_g1_i1.p1  ORF type:complete len:254 (+),score=29.53 TRINITY_DN14652_c0_g1_i1:101-763(+)
MAATTTAAMNIAAPVQIGNPAQKASRVFNTVSVARVEKASLAVRASAEEKQTRRNALALIATTVGVALSGNAQAVTGVKLEGPPPLAGGLPGTENSDQARDFDAPLKERFFIQIESPEGALKRAKEVVGVLDEVQGYINKGAWVYVRNELRSELYYLRYDLATVINSKAKAEKKALTAELKSVIESLESLDFAARKKNGADVQKYFDAASSKINTLLAKL